VGEGVLVGAVALFGLFAVSLLLFEAVYHLFAVGQEVVEGIGYYQPVNHPVEAAVLSGFELLEEYHELGYLEVAVADEDGFGNGGNLLQVGLFLDTRKEGEIHELGGEPGDGGAEAVGGLHACKAGGAADEAPGEALGDVAGLERGVEGFEERQVAAIPLPYFSGPRGWRRSLQGLAGVGRPSCWCCFLHGFHFFL